jgi:hypothetical protein
MLKKEENEEREVSRDFTYRTGERTVRVGELIGS